ncbi:MAG: lysophospholipid acyltransferase family protein [Pseudomonadales bacterium]|nr:lysophospholipid acyltransferase family protein [Pseudomonadales bacterium]
MLARRLITVPLFVAATLLVTALLPLLLIVALVLRTLPATRGALPTLLFVCSYLWCETIGIFSAAWIYVRHRQPADFLDANYRLQGWWANALKVSAERLFRLRFEITGEAALDGQGALMLPRHASIADTVIPMVFYAIPYGIRLRYVLKNELLIDPCLDIVGNRLPNFFVDRGGEDSERARIGVARLLDGLRPDEGVLIYPEGTRFSPGKRAALRARYSDSPDLNAQLDRWEVVLPPRLGGTLAMLGNNPGRDLVFCAHAGFEGSSHFSNLINGSWVGARIRVHFWRIPFGEIPAGRDASREFLFRQWDRMQDTVRALTAGRPAPDPSVPYREPDWP